MKSLKRFRAHIIVTSILVGMIALPFWLSLLADYQRHLDSDLIVFVRSGSVLEVRSILKQGANPNAYDLNDLKAESPIEHIVALITHKHNYAFHGERCALSYAIDVDIQSYHPTIVRLLLENGADVKLIHNRSDAALLPLAVKYARFELVALLLDHGANANTCDDSGTTALRVGIQSGFPEMVQRLLEHGAHVDLQKDVYGHNDIDVARMNATNRPDCAAQYNEILILLKDASKAHGH